MMSHLSLTLLSLESSERTQKENIMGKVISKDGTSIAYNQSGNGSPIILVDGAMCYRAFGPMEKLSALLSEHFRVFTYDRRGRGESGDTAPYAVEREIEDIEALINEAGGSAFVYAISSGAGLALSAAARGLAIKKLALYEPPFTLAGLGQRQSEEYVTRLNELVSAGRQGEAVELFMTRTGMPPEAIAQMRNAPMWPMFEAIAPTLVYDAIIMGDSSVPTEQAATVLVPTLVMDGGASPAWMREAAQAVADVLPHAQHRTISGQTHDVEASALAPVLEEFFAS
jgi:pimeloyl-ACP methyl ester carboxylesterase